MVPFGPVGATVRRSTPRSLASLRTGGLASTLTVAIGSAEAAAWAGAAGADAPAGADAAGVAAGVGAAASAGAGVAVSAGAGVAPAFRGLRLASTERGPYPTSTEVRPPGAGPPMSPGSIASSSAGTGMVGSMSSRGLVGSAPVTTATGSVPASAAAADAAVGADAAGAVPPDESVSIVMIGCPTSTVVPSLNRSSLTTPANGLGSSTAAFAVSISTMIWLTLTWSPGCTYHLRISASVRPSPTSGSLNCLMSATLVSLSVRQGAVDGVEYPVQVREELLLHPGRWVRRVQPAEPQDRRVERV